MKLHHLPSATRVRRGAGSLTPLVAVFSLLLPLSAAQAATMVPLGTADSFAILAGSTITNTGPSTVTGDIGLHPGTAYTGSEDVTHDGSVHLTDAVALEAKNDLTTAYNNAAGQPVSSTIGTELGGAELTPGVYNSEAGTFGITGTLTLDAEGDPNAVFIFQMESTLTTASASSVSLINGASLCNVFWQVGSSAELGTNSTFRGTIMALESITLTTGATVEGRVLARNGAVTLDTNTITNEACVTPTDDDTTTTTAPADDDTTTTTAQVVTPPRGPVATGGNPVDTAPGWMPLLVAGALMLVAVGGTVGIVARRHARARLPKVEDA